MDRFEEMRVFVRIAERQSFTRASDDLQIPRATVTNLIKRMEERLGARLLERTTRTVRLTHDGEAYYAPLRAADRGYGRGGGLVLEPRAERAVACESAGHACSALRRAGAAGVPCALSGYRTDNRRRRPPGRSGARGDRLRAAGGHAAGFVDGRAARRATAAGDGGEPRVSGRSTANPPIVERSNRTARSTMCRAQRASRCRSNSTSKAAYADAVARRVP